MGRVLFASDLDNTLLFSYRHRQASDRCVERLDGREQGFCTRRSLELLAKVQERTLFIPVTTRSVAQYQRIEWPAAYRPRYAVTTNGGVLLVDGQPDPVWSRQTEGLTTPWRAALLDLEHRLPEIPVPKRSRMVDGIYLFAACDSPEAARSVARRFEGETELKVEVSGRKVYFFPPPVHKGEALRRLQERFRPDRTICAGDSVIDVPMLLAAGTAIIPDRELLPLKRTGVLVLPEQGVRFPDFVLETVLDQIKG